MLVNFSGIRHPEEMSVMKYMDKDDLKKNIKENLNQKKKKQGSMENLGVNGNGVYHSPSGSIERLSPYHSRSPAGPSPTVSTLLPFMEVFPINVCSS